MVTSFISSSLAGLIAELATAGTAGHLILDDGVATEVEAAGVVQFAGILPGVVVGVARVLLGVADVEVAKVLGVEVEAAGALLGVEFLQAAEHLGVSGEGDMLRGGDVFKFVEIGVAPDLEQSQCVLSLQRQVFVLLPDLKIFNPI